MKNRGVVIKPSKRSSNLPSKRFMASSKPYDQRKPDMPYYLSDVDNISHKKNKNENIYSPRKTVLLNNKKFYYIDEFGRHVIVDKTNQYNTKKIVVKAIPEKSYSEYLDFDNVKNFEASQDNHIQKYVFDSDKSKDVNHNVNVENNKLDSFTKPNNAYFPHETKLLENGEKENNKSDIVVPTQENTKSQNDIQIITTTPVVVKKTKRIDNGLHKNNRGLIFLKVIKNIYSSGLFFLLGIISIGLYFFYQHKKISEHNAIYRIIIPIVALFVFLFFVFLIANMIKNIYKAEQKRSMILKNYLDDNKSNDFFDYTIFYSLKNFLTVLLCILPILIIVLSIIFSFLYHYEVFYFLNDIIFPKWFIYYNLPFFIFSSSIVAFIVFLILATFYEFINFFIDKQYIEKQTKKI